jgi:heptosyltransferase-2
VSLPLRATWVRFPRYVGDAVMHLPLLRVLRDVAESPLVVWGPASTVALVEGTPFVDGVWKEDDKPGAWALAKVLRDHQAVRSIHFPKSLRPALAAFLARVPERLGVSESLAGLFNTHSLPFWSQTGLAHERYRRVLLQRWPQLPPLPWADYTPPVPAVDHPAPYLCVMPGASKQEKAWDPAAFSALARLAEAEGLHVVVLGGPKEKALGAQVAGSAGMNLCGDTTLPQAAAWLRSARGAVGNDSGLAHLAAATGTPTLALFGDTDPDTFRPFGPKVAVLPRQGLTVEQAFACLHTLMSPL